ncbi:DNA replication initiation factor cdc45 [Coemansia interrupta]|uniref:DNA replication initiation factor cdc45 n=1 Tax=Coemansia interrupta TaxID=1126814 RepID=A0A9W8HHJ8_9FUNG|nr:DNA replication initiation factor cdc45 [Coemansia interrupta]
MVYVASNRYEDAYQRIVDGAGHGSGTSVVIFAAADGDSLCALHILTTLLKRDSIGHRIVPVHSYGELAEQSTRQISSSEQVRTAVFINCGGSVDIQEYVALRDSLTVVIVDSHRPFNLYNIFWNDSVQCLDDGDVEESMAELRAAFEDIEFGGDSDEDSGSDSDDGAGARRLRTGDDPDAFVRVQRERAERRETRARSRMLVQAYYAQGAYHGQPSAVGMLQMAEQLGHPPTMDTVWSAIAGLATQRHLQHIQGAGYDLLVGRLRDTVRRISTPAVAAAAREPAEGFNPAAEQPSEEPGGSAVGPRQAISESAELRFALLRHWSLDSAMRFSPLVAGRLATWSSKGRARLLLLVAKLGLSQAEAQAPFVHLAPDLRAQLHQRMLTLGADYSLGDALAPGFVRAYGWRRPSVSSDDMALALLALLHEGFYAAYDALTQPEALQRGLDLAMALQKKVVGLGLQMLERQAVKTLRAFRLAMVDESLPAPALRQLALFLMHTLRDRCRPAHARLPFVIAAPGADAAAESMLVVGVVPEDSTLHVPGALPDGLAGSRFSGRARNHFGMVFDDVAADLGAEVRAGFFDSAVVEIKRPDVAAFVDKLRRHL